MDSQAFPFNSSAAPKLSLGAWSSRETYSPADLSSVVAYARDRGVRIMVEIDTPGHSYSWSYGYPDVITSCPDIISRYNPADATMDPSNVRMEAFWRVPRLSHDNSYFHLLISLRTPNPSGRSKHSRFWRPC